MTQYIKAPFNFVPLNDKVFYPRWANEVSHDIPFSDGESGEIELELTAMTPVFVRNGHTRDDANAKNANYTSFSKEESVTYFIPATSVKGMIRNVLEIISFGKMKVDKNMKFAQRDWENPDLYDLKAPATQTKIRCGWLKIDDSGDGKIIDCGLPMRINHLRIDEFFKSREIDLSFEDHFSEESGKIDLNKAQKIGDVAYDPKDAAYKYALLNDSNYKKLSGLHFVVDEEYNCETTASEFGFVGRRYKVSDAPGEVKGTIVFTGQPDKWKKGKRGTSAGKFYEFIFPEGTEREDYKISKETLDQFKVIYKDSMTWKFFRFKNRIPVFFRLEKEKEKGKEKIKDFGLALLYRIPYKNSVDDVLRRNQNLNEQYGKHDMSECIFGYANNPEALKSRVQVSHFKVLDSPVVMKEVKTTLASPKASFYPIYLRQKGVNGKVGKYQKQISKKKTITLPDYIHYSSDDAELSGWKRYPVRDKEDPTHPVNESLSTKFCPLPSMTKFKGTIRFHNLRPVELGALLSAITFHGNQDIVFHSLGAGKPLGYGKMKIENMKVTVGGGERNIEPYLIDFEENLDKELNESWAETSQIRELFSMAAGTMDSTQFDYMQMDNDKKKNEFQKAKSEAEYLQRFSELTKKPFIVHSLFAPVKSDRERETKERVKNSIHEIISNEIERITETYFESGVRRELLEESLREEVNLLFNNIDQSSIADLSVQFSVNSGEVNEDVRRLIEKARCIAEREHIAMKALLDLEAKRQKEKEEGVAPILKRVKNFDQAIAQISDWIRKTKAESIPESQRSLLQEALRNFYENSNPRGRRMMANPSPWKKIAGWVGESVAKEWYNQIIG